MSTFVIDRIASSKQQVQWLEQRGWVYQLLVDFLGRAPRLSLIAQYRCKMILHQDELLCEGEEMLNHYLLSIPETGFREVCYEEAEEYERLFRGYSSKVPLYENIYRARTEGVDGMRLAAEISTMYGDCGVVFNKINGERDDHLALQLEFMAVMADRMMMFGSLPDRCLELTNQQISFLEDHLIKWTPSFAEELSERTTSPLYKSLAAILKQFIIYDLGMLHNWRNSLSRVDRV